MVNRNLDPLDVDERLELTGCKMEYDKLQNCIDKFDRDWRKCQIELKDLSKCLESKKPG
ncbi:hypothetical protein TpMuguga_02g02300 [Theileria parva strain Muguga]|uniref:uncharacterized protein n=1 Tax=Theileria parva strain Muguga TaxID=333668 RepID=UPI001C620C8B|nr:uncharacterized protein TpMuguga_02g02300 [Theileria parva strain Muguga]KAF5153602.1 hypothetical protein TpMuguga_02g02300 [Theileria parva strain Muguga]